VVRTLQLNKVRVWVKCGWWSASTSAFYPRPSAVGQVSLPFIYLWSRN